MTQSEIELMSPTCRCGNPKTPKSKSCISCWKSYLRTPRRKPDDVVFIQNRERCRYIPLPKGKQAICSEADFAEFCQYNWQTSKGTRSSYFSVYRMINVNGRQTRVFMNRTVCPSEAGLDPFHRNGNRLDCSRNNLVLSTNVQAVHSAGKRPDNTSGYKGVFKVKEKGIWGGKWTSTIKYKTERFYLGVFPTAYEASLAYQRKATELVGEFAYSE